MIRSLLKKNPLFPLSLPLLRQKIASPPDWALEQIEEELAPHRKIGLFHETRADLFRFVIRANRLLAPTALQSLQHPRIFKMVFFFRKVLRALPFPDVEFLFSTADHCEGEALQGPIFLISKTRCNKQACLFPHIEWLRHERTTRKELKQQLAEWPWEVRKELLFWRGSTTGSGYREGKNSRKRIVELAKEHPAEIDASFVQFIQTERGQKIPQQLPKEQIRHKYLLALDGNCFPGSLFWQLGSGSATFKHDSPFLEWYYRGLKPFVHYIPFAPDASDLLAKKQWAQEHDAAAKNIAAQALAFAENHLTIEDTIAYVYHLLKRYATIH